MLDLELRQLGARPLGPRAGVPSADSPAPRSVWPSRRLLPHWARPRSFSSLLTRDSAQRVSFCARPAMRSASSRRSRSCITLASVVCDQRAQVVLDALRARPSASSARPSALRGPRPPALGSRNLSSFQLARQLLDLDGATVVAQGTWARPRGLSDALRGTLGAPSGEASLVTSAGAAGSWTMVMSSKSTRLRASRVPHTAT